MSSEVCALDLSKAELPSYRLESLQLLRMRVRHGKHIPRSRAGTGRPL